MAKSKRINSKLRVPGRNEGSVHAVSRRSHIVPNCVRQPRVFLGGERRSAGMGKRKRVWE